MSLITRCPACETMFKVVPDQLRISEGWVRCGLCDEVFDASLHLQAAPDGGMAAAPDKGVAANFEATEAPEARPESLDMDIDADSVRLDRPAELPVEQMQGLPGAAEHALDQSLPEPISEEFSQPAPLTATLPAYVAIADPDDPKPDLGAGLRDVSFLRDQKNDAVWHKPLMRATLGLLSLTLLLGLSGQIVFYERDRIAAFEPGLKPWLQALCGPLNCTLSALRRIETIVIDSASFTRIRGDAYRLNFTLKNTAATALAVPAMELTLTDSLDQAVVRRVFLPGEFGFKSDTLAAGSEWPASLAMAVNAGGTTDRVAGYRVLAFYP